MLDTKGSRITYFGHNTFSLTTPSGHVALIDPWIMTNPACPAQLRSVPKLDVIFLSHGHADHFGDLLALAKQHKPKIVAIFEIAMFIASQGFEKEICPMSKGGTQRVGEFEVTMTHAFHSSSIEQGGTFLNGGEPAGLIIRVPGGFTIYHAGDTAVFGDMKLIAELYKPDLAMLPIGDLFTMDRAKLLTRSVCWGSSRSFRCTTRPSPCLPARLMASVRRVKTSRDSRYTR